jgi:hypothetical protein
VVDFARRHYQDISGNRDIAATAVKIRRADTAAASDIRRADTTAAAANISSRDGNMLRRPGVLVTQRQYGAWARFGRWADVQAALEWEVRVLADLMTAFYVHRFPLLAQLTKWNKKDHRFQTKWYTATVGVCTPSVLALTHTLATPPPPSAFAPLSSSNGPNDRNDGAGRGLLDLVASRGSTLSAPTVLRQGAGCGSSMAALLDTRKPRPGNAPKKGAWRDDALQRENTNKGFASGEGSISECSPSPSATSSIVSSRASTSPFPLPAMSTWSATDTPLSRPFSSRPRSFQFV